MKKLGVIGGMGPMATVYFMQMVVEMTRAETDQEHIEMLIHNCPSIPDRTSYILGEGRDDPGAPMAAIGRKLAECGADVIAIPCVTANYFCRQLSAEIPVPIINSITETVQYLAEYKTRRVGLMATDGTVQSALFQKAFAKAGIQVVLPGEKGQKDVMHLIYQNIKATRPAEMGRFEQVSRELRGKGAEIILLGCTELSMIRRDERIGPDYLDVMQVLARASVERCGSLKEQYRDLITC